MAGRDGGVDEGEAQLTGAGWDDGAGEAGAEMGEGRGALVSCVGWNLSPRSLGSKMGLTCQRLVQVAYAYLSGCALIAEKFTPAAKQYEANPMAMHLRGMNMLLGGSREIEAMIIVPSSALSLVWRADR